MIFYFLIGLALLGAAIVFANWYANASPASAKLAVKIGLGLGGIMFFVFLLSRGGMPAIVSGLIMLAPFLLGIRRAIRRARATQGPTPGGQSTVASAWFDMTLDHDNGEISGRIRLGEHAGKHLDDLTEAELDELLAACRQDENSRRLLEAYLAKRFGYSYEDDQTDTSDSQSSSDRSANAASGMDVEEACKILGVPRDADAAEITSAHKRLIANSHPDKGGSAYLAAKINEARDVLLSRV